MYRLKKILIITPPSSPGEKIKIVHPATKETLFIGGKELAILRAIAKSTPAEAAARLAISPSEINSFVEKLLQSDFLDTVEKNSFNPINPTQNLTSNFKPKQIIQAKETRPKESPQPKKHPPVWNEAEASRLTSSLTEGEKAKSSLVHQGEEMGREKNEVAVILRSDLDLSQDEDSLLIVDPLSNRAFSLGYAETKILNALLMGSIKKVAYENNLSEAEVQKFIQSLANKSLLLKPSPEAFSQEIPKRSILSLLVQRFKIGNPDKLLEQIDLIFGWLWKAPFNAIHFALFIFAIYLWVDQFNLFTNYGFPKIVENSLINGLIFLFIVSCVLTVHEFAHGLALKSYGGRVPEIGLFLMYGFPSAYTNVTDAYRLQKKSEKAWVVLAGVFFQLWIGCLALVLWAFSNKPTLVSDLAYMLCLASFINLFINLNPLIKLDGYYLLTLLLGKPNLREKSWNFLRSGFREANSFGEAVLYFVYGISSVIYTAGLVTLLLGTAFKFGIENIPFTGGLILLLFALASQTPLPEKEVLAVDSSGNKTTLISQSHQQSLTKNQSKRNAMEIIPPAPFNKGGGERSSEGDYSLPQNNKKSFNLIPGFIFVLLITLLFIEIPYQVGGEVEVNPFEGKRALIRSPIQGVIKSLKVKSGDYVSKGQSIVEITDWALLDQISQATGGNPFSGGSSDTASVSTGAPKLDSLGGQIEQSQIQQRKLEIELKKAELNYQNEIKKANTYTKLAKEGAYPKTLAEQAILNSQLAREEINKLKEEINLSRQTTQIARSNFNGLSGQIQFYKQKSAFQSLKSPISGYVLTEDTDLKLGSVTSPEQVLFSVADLSQVQVKVKVSQENLSFVQKEQPITLTIRAYPGRKFKGKVFGIAISSEDPKQSDPAITQDLTKKRWNVTMTIDNKDNLLKPGMTGYAYIDSTQRLKIWQLISRELYRVFPLERFAVFRDSFFKATF